MVDAYELIQQLIAVLPTTMRTKTDAITAFKWVDEDEDLDHGALPYGTVKHISRHDIEGQHDWAQVQVLTDKTETIPATTATVYQVSERDIASVQSLDGTVGGLPHTFTSGEFNVVRTETYVTYDAIEFLGPFPDNGTDIDVTYKHRQYQQVRARRLDHTFRLYIWCGPLAVGDRGVTVAYAKSRLASQLIDYLERFILPLEGVTLSSDNLVRLGAIGTPGIIGSDRADSITKGFLDVRVHEHQQVVIETVGAIGDVITAGSVSGP